MKRAKWRLERWLDITRLDEPIYVELKLYLGACGSAAAGCRVLGRPLLEIIVEWFEFATGEREVRLQLGGLLIGCVRLSCEIPPEE